MQTHRLGVYGHLSRFKLAQGAHVRIIAGSQKELKLATLIDFQTSDQQTIENLYEKKLLAKKNVRTFADFTGTKEADIEDMFDRQFYLDLVNAEYIARPEAGQADA